MNASIIESTTRTSFDELVKMPPAVSLGVARVTESAERPPFALSVRELIVLQTLPAAMEALLDWHEVQATLADAMDMPESGRYHDERKAAIRIEIARLEKVREGLSSQKSRLAAQMARHIKAKHPDFVHKPTPAKPEPKVKEKSAYVKGRLDAILGHNR